MVKRVIQLDSTGCGLACIAMLTNSTYICVKKDALNLNICNIKGPFYTEIENLRALAKIRNLKISKRRNFKNWDLVPSRSILAIRYQLKNWGEDWHWVVFINNGSSKYVLDPLASIKSNKRTDFSRIKPKWIFPTLNT